MESDPLQQLRDVHLPPDPAWWPPAFGWWLLAGILVAALIWGIHQAYLTYRRRAPIRSAASLLDKLYAAYRANELSAVEYLHQGNEILKRLLVRAFGRVEYARLSSDAWLAELDRISASSFFTTGDGRVLGDTRFQPDPEVDVDALNRELRSLLARVRP